MEVYLLFKKVFRKLKLLHIPVDNFGTVVGENPTPYGALWAVNMDCQLSTG